MTEPKYLSKKMVQIDNNLRLYLYFYATHIDVYFSPKSADVEQIKVRIELPGTDSHCDYWAPIIAKLNN